MTPRPDGSSNEVQNDGRIKACVTFDLVWETCGFLEICMCVWAIETLKLCVKLKLYGFFCLGKYLIVVFAELYFVFVLDFR